MKLGEVEERTIFTTNLGVVGTEPLSLKRVPTETALCILGRNIAIFYFA